MNDARTKKLIAALREDAGWSSERIAALLHEDVTKTFDVYAVRQLRRDAHEKTPHVYPEGVYGAPCQRCGSRQGWQESCLPAREVKVDRETFLALLDIAKASLSSPWHDTAKRLAAALRDWMAYSTRHCGCDAQDADICNAHQALGAYQDLTKRMTK